MATGFLVSAIRVRQDGAPGADFDYTVFAPSGTQVAVIKPNAPGIFPPPAQPGAPVPANVGQLNVRGIWTIRITPRRSPAVAAPSLRQLGPLGNPTVVFPYGVQAEGILSLLFEGDEVVEQPVVCPMVTNATAMPGACNSNGTVTVAFSATVTPPAGGGGPVQVYWDYDGTNFGRPVTVTAANTVVMGSHDYPGDGTTRIARLMVSLPTGCMATPVTFPVSDCTAPACPRVTWSRPQIGECTDNLRRPVTITATVTPAGSMTMADLIDDTTGAVLDTRTSGVPFTLTATLDYAPGMYTVSVRDTPRPPCSGGGISFTVPGCKGAEGCPTRVQIDIGPEGDCVNGQRSVTITATVTPAPGSPTSAALVYNGMTLDSLSNQNAPFQLTKTRPFPPGPQTVAVNILAPVGCDPTPKDFTVSECPVAPPPPPPPPSNGDEGSGCLIGRWLVVLLFALAAFLAFVAVCVPPLAMSFLIASGVALALALVLLALWWAFCGSRCGFLILLWQVALVVGIAALYLGGCPACPQLLVVGIGLVLLAVVLFFVWVAVCHPSSCVVLRELTAAFVIGSSTALDYLTRIVPCGSTAVPLAVAAIAAVLTVITLARCTSR